MKKKLAAKIYRTVSTYILLLLVSATFLPFSLFHNHSSDKLVCHTYNCKPLENDALQDEKAGFSHLKQENILEECLFCAWQLGVRLTYVIPEISIFLPDFNNSGLTEQYLSSIDFLTVANIINKGPPTFLPS